MSYDTSTHEWGVVRGMSGPERTERPRASARSNDHAERINAFVAGDAYLFRHYFDDDSVFDAVKEYYNQRRYRFEVPADAFDDVVGVLAGHGYDVTVVEDPSDLTVVVPKYTDHPEAVFENAVLQVSTDDHNVFVLADAAAVEAAVDAGATHLDDTPLGLHLHTDPGIEPVTVADVAADA